MSYKEFNFRQHIDIIATEKEASVVVNLSIPVEGVVNFATKEVKELHPRLHDTAQASGSSLHKSRFCKTIIGSMTRKHQVRCQTGFSMQLRKVCDPSRLFVSLDNKQGILRELYHAASTLAPPGTPAGTFPKYDSCCYCLLFSRISL